MYLNLNLYLPKIVILALIEHTIPTVAESICIEFYHVQIIYIFIFYVFLKQGLNKMN